jgi:DNA-binding NarL/FixJ family response regulator
MPEVEGSRLAALVVEDEMLVLLDLEDMLADLNIEVAAAFATNSSAIKWLVENEVQLAIIDYQLVDGTSEPLAKVLRERLIPTVVFTGYYFSQDLHREALQAFPG